VQDLFKNMIGRCWPERLSQGGVKKELANPKAKIKIHEGSVRSQFKNHLGRYPLGSKSQRDIKKQLPARRVEI
jgi:hypothetical protein